MSQVLEQRGQQRGQGSNREEGVTSDGLHSTRAEAFQALFADPGRHHEAIGLALHRLVERVARQIDFPSRQCRVELTHDVYLYCLERVGLYDPAGGQAGRWFVLTARRRFWEALRRERHHAIRSLSWIDHSEARLRPVPQPIIHRAGTARFVIPSATRRRLTDYLDRLLERAVTMHGEGALGHDAQITRGMVLALQEVRHRIAGSYRRLRDSDLAFSERFRMGGLNDE